MIKKNRQPHDDTKYDVFLKGTNVDLVVLTPEIVEKTNWYRWFNDEEVTSVTQHHYFPNTKDDQLEYFQNHIRGNQNKLQLGIVRKKDQMFIGIVSLDNIHPVNHSADFAIIIGEISSRRINVFVEASYLILRHGFESLNLHRISGGSLSRDVIDLACNNLGFFEEGTQRQSAYKNGTYVDTYRIGMLREDFEKKLKKPKKKPRQYRKAAPPTPTTSVN